MNFNFKRINVKSVNDSIAEITISAQSPNESDEYFDVNKFHFSEIIEIFNLYKEKYGDPKANEQVAESNIYDASWDFLEYKINFLGEKKEILRFMPSDGYIKQYNDFVKEFDLKFGRENRDDMLFVLAFKVQRMDGKIKGVEEYDIAPNIEIKFTSKHFERIINENLVNFNKNQSILDSLERERAKEKI